MSKQVWIDCECHSEGIMVLKEDGMVELSFYKYGQVAGKFSFWRRLQFCWQMLRHGRPWSDMVILKKEKVEKLQTTLAALMDDEPDL